ncbi:alpha/beta hydrolase [Aestuariivivens sediminicola]|uniref:alpha/beta hydrolase n=1 Tax=Aestuariivivens sediminicola TaxID=2913560 RepID=UPI001F597C32|nr:alpha/beta hydrolase [Aestuariivivens sediminicola]
MQLRLLILYLGFFGLMHSQNVSFVEKNINVSRHIDGTLTVPAYIDTMDLAIIIGGTGPVDRNGNQNLLKNNALKKLSEALVQNGIATYRYDKRNFKQIRQQNIDPNIKFDDFVNDAIEVINYFKNTRAYHKIYVVGHSQGSLVGLIASKELADGFISLAGAGHNIGDVLITQISKTAPQFSEESETVIEQLKNGKVVQDYPKPLSSIFAEDIQPFMINWMQYDPRQIISQLNMPILIINGTKDLQTTVEEAKELKNAAPKAQLELIDKMNHVLVLIEGDDLENSKSYNEPNREISQELIKHITTFIKSNH